MDLRLGSDNVGRDAAGALALVPGAAVLTRRLSNAHRFVATSMAEVVSAVPSAGGPMHWAGVLARPRYSAFAAYATGWFNFLGQAAVTASIVFGNSNLSAHPQPLCPRRLEPHC